VRAKVKKWGNSLAVRLPKALVSEIGLKNESIVELSIEDHRLVIEPRASNVMKLEALLHEITDENLHEEIDTGASVGREEW
jgi:antitoxin MazE